VSRHLLVLAAIAAAVVLANCGGLPSNFRELPLEEKIAAYDEHFRHGGLELVEGTAYISWHGWEAAKLMVPYLDGRQLGGIPPTVALNIIRDVQARGCDLRGTQAERAVQRLSADNDTPDYLRNVAASTLEEIRVNSRFEPGQLDGLTAGPCEKALAAEDGEGDSGPSAP
jgi:hypothetical protein